MIDLNVIVKLVNLHGDGKHAVATLGTLQFFDAGYINECIKRGLATGRYSFADMETAKRWLNPSRPERPKPKPKVLHHL